MKLYTQLALTNAEMVKPSATERLFVSPYFD